MRVLKDYRPSPTAAVISVLSRVLDCPVSMQVPTERPPVFVTVQRTGGAMRDVVTDRARIAIQCWANNLPMAENMCFKAGAVLSQWAESGETVEGVAVRFFKEVTAPLHFPDESGHPRFQIFVELEFIVH
ncbi:MAG: hypothetical protein WAN89_02755 [Lawsonella sp.]